MRAIIILALAALPLIAGGCSSDSASQANADSKKASRPAPAPTPSAATEEVAPKSVFTVDATSRDPFFPKARLAQADSNGTQDVTFDVPAMLQANLHGIVSSGGKSIAYVSNVMLEPGRNALIPIRAGGQERHISVRCREVTKEAVVLEVQGYPEPIKLTRVAH